MILLSLILSLLTSFHTAHASFEQFTLLPTKVPTTAPLFTTTSTIHSRVIGSLHFDGQYFDCNGKLPAGYSLRCTAVDGFFGTPVVQILKNGRNYAKYENVFDGGVSTDGKYIALQNATKSKNDTLVEHVRIIIVNNKKFIRLPQMDCTKNIMRWSQGQLITMSNVGEEYAGETTTMCIWNTDGTLVHYVSGKNAVTATTQRSIDRIGMLPAQTTALYTFGKSSDQTEISCTLYLFDTKTKREKSVVITPNIEDGYYCTSLVELDLKNTTLDTTHFRYRERNFEGNIVSDWYTIK